MRFIYLAAISVALVVLAQNVGAAMPPKKICCSSVQIKKCQFEDSCSDTEEKVKDSCCPPTSDKECICNKSEL